LAAGHLCPAHFAFPPPLLRRLMARPLKAGNHRPIKPFMEQTMTHRTMRDFHSSLEQKGLLRRISRRVDRMWEPAALAKWMYQAMPAERRFGMFFESVKGSAIPLVTAALGANAKAYATALDVAEEDINAAWMKAGRNRKAPVV